MNQNERQINGKLYDINKVENNWMNARRACKKFNDSNFWEDNTELENLKKIFKHVGSNFVLTPPFYCDHGIKISFGNHFYANTGLTILDENDVTIGNHVFLGPHVSIYTASHPIDANIRNTDLEIAKPVTIGNNIWIGGNVVINPGVSIGDNSVIGSGSVVTKDIPSNVIAAGNPCRVLRQISEKDKEYWEREYQEYLEDIKDNCCEMK